MSDYINRAKLLEQIEADSKGNEGQYGDEWLFLDTIKSIPSADVKKTGEVIVNMTVDEDALKRMAFKLIEENDFVKVVRCKDCIHNDQCKHRVVMWVEDPINTWHKDIDYCSYGERKDDE